MEVPETGLTARGLLGAQGHFVKSDTSWISNETEDVLNAISFRTIEQGGLWEGVSGDPWEAGAMQGGFVCFQKLENTVCWGLLTLTVNLECGFPARSLIQKISSWKKCILVIALDVVHKWGLSGLLLEGLRRSDPEFHCCARVESLNRQLWRARAQSSTTEYVRKGTLSCT